MKQILETETCRILLENSQYVLYMRMGKSWVQNKPFDGDLRGLISALTLSLDIISGKVWPVAVKHDVQIKQIEGVKK